MKSLYSHQCSHTCAFTAFVCTLIALGVSLISTPPSAIAAPRATNSAPSNDAAVGNAAVSNAVVVIDAVVASVDEKPITLKELQSRLSPARPLAFTSLATDHEAQQTLDLMISERVLEAEATAKRVSVADTEIEEYINEVAAKNSLSRGDFEGVLQREGKTLDWYRRQVRSDILKSKLASTISRGGVSVSDQEIEEYLSSSPSFKTEGASLKLRVISVPAVSKTPDEMAQQVQTIESALTAGESFEEVAKKYSQGPHAADGGLLGVVAEKDLSSTIFDAVLSLEAGQHSKPVVSDTETQIFFVEERYAAKSDDEDEDVDEESEQARREEARKAIQKRKTEEKLSSYFAIELNKNHTIDKKF